MRAFWCVIVAGGLGASGAEGVIQYTIGAGAPQPLLNNTINVDTIDGIVQRVRVFDDANADESIVGQLVIVGDTANDGNLDLQVASSAVVNAFAAATDVPIAVGLRDFGGLTFSTTALRNATRVSISIAGDVTGDITVGGIYRVDADTGPTGATGGRILGNLTATTRDNGFVANIPAVGYVRAAKLLQGNLTATGDAADVGSIGTIVVGGFSLAA